MAKFSLFTIFSVQSLFVVVVVALDDRTDRSEPFASTRKVFALFLRGDLLEDADEEDGDQRCSRGVGFMRLNESLRDGGGDVL